MKTKHCSKVLSGTDPHFENINLAQYSPGQRQSRVGFCRQFSLAISSLYIVKSRVQLFFQLLLGGASWVTRYGWPGFLADNELFAAYLIRAQALWPSIIVTAHVATGSLILALAVLISVRSMRLRHRLAVPAFSFMLADAGWGGGLG